jgi:diguanylate cyclase (GGDEF)-like protein
MREKSDEEILSDIHKLNLPKNTKIKKSGVIVGKERRHEPPAAQKPDTESFEEEIPQRRIEDVLPRTNNRLKRRIIRYSFFQGFSIVSFTEWMKTFVSYFNPSVEYNASSPLMRKLFLPSYGNDSGLLRKLVTDLSDIARLLNGDQDERIGSAVQHDMEVQAGPFAQVFFNVFYPLDSRFRNNLIYIEKLVAQGEKVPLNQLAWPVRAVFRLLLQIENIEAYRINDMLMKAVEVNLQWVRKEYEIVPTTARQMTQRLQNAMPSFERTLLNLKQVRRELYPALLFCLNSFYEFEDRSKDKYELMLSFLELSKADLLSYKRFEKDRKERIEIEKAQAQADQINKLEEEKEAGFHQRYSKTLETFEALYPGAELHKLDRAYLLPYFQNFYKDSLRLPDEVKKLSKEDPYRFLVIFHRIVWEYISALNGISLETILSRSDLNSRLANVKNRWYELEEKLLKPYEQEMGFISRRSGSLEDRRLFLEKHAKTSERKLNEIRKHFLKDFRSASGKLMLQVAKDGVTAPGSFRSPKAYEVLQDMYDLIGKIVEDIHPGVKSDSDGLNRKIYEDLRKTPIIEFNLFLTPGTPEYRPSIRQVKRYCEALYGKPLRAIMAESQVWCINFFHQLLELLLYVFTSPESFAVKSRDVIFLAEEEEQAEWISEDTRGQRSYQIFIAHDESRFLDPLTDVYNRGKIESICRDEFNKSEGRNICFAMLDIDHFKSFNDDYGHQVGDLVLQAVARTIKQTLGTGDTVGRYGGEEFLVFFNRGLQESVLELERIRHAVQQTKLPLPEDPKKLLSVTISCGLAAGDTLPDSEAVINFADKALYESKKNGRNQVRFFDHEESKPSMHIFTSYLEYVAKMKSK